jgi:hypothetical protein
MYTYIHLYKAKNLKFKNVNKGEDGKKSTVIQMRQHHCLCSACQAKTYDECKYKSTVGEWKNTPISMIKLKKTSEVVPPLQKNQCKGNICRGAHNKQTQVCNECCER